MKRLPTTEELQETADEVSKQLSTLSVYDFDKVLASLEVQIWEAEREALLALGGDDTDYYAGWLNGLAKFRNLFMLARDAKAYGQN